MAVLTRTEAVAQHLLRPVDAEARARARLHLLDWMGCVAGARRSEAAALMGVGGAPDALAAATMLGNVLEMDDVHRTALLHPGPVVWPALLQVAEPAAGLDALLDAGVAGYEAMIAIGATFDGAHYRHWHNSATAGTFGAAAAAAVLLGGDAEAIADALGLAGSVTGGLWQMRHEPGVAKQWHLLHAAGTGVRAARLALNGGRGPRHILEGPQGLYAATCETPRDLSLGDGWRIAEVSFKPWGACRHAHPAIDAALALAGRRPLEGAIAVETYGDALVFCDRPHPADPAQAKFSLQHAIAVVAERGEPSLADFEPEAIAALAPARARVTVRETAEFTDRYPAHFGARVLCGGDAEALVDTRGDPERPLSRDGVIAKARALMAWGGIERTQAERGIAAALESERPGAVRDWLEAAL